MHLIDVVLGVCVRDKFDSGIMMSVGHSWLSLRGFLTSRIQAECGNNLEVVAQSLWPEFDPLNASSDTMKAQGGSFLGLVCQFFPALQR